MVYHRFSDNSPYETKWVYATSIHPKSHVVKWACSECGRGAEYPAGAFDVTVEGGSAFPDVFGCGEYPLLILSQRAVSVFKTAGITCFHEYPVRVAGKQASRAKIEDAPSYTRIEIMGECIVDLAESGYTIKSICERCGILETQPSIGRPFTIINGSWDGSDLFRDRRHFPRVALCTQIIVELAKASGLTNCLFSK
jgi:hypothetical protein